jgi:hypothetical protein
VVYRFVIRATTLLAGLGAALVLASPIRAAAPNYILVTGPGLTHPILLSNWNENLALLLAVGGARRAIGITAERLEERPRLDLAEFWGWSGLPRPTRASKTPDHGHFYPAHGRQLAVIVLMVNGDTLPRLAPPTVLRILARHGIPLRL